jgi:hypothetical protein
MVVGEWHQDPQERHPAAIDANRGGMPLLRARVSEERRKLVSDTIAWRRLFLVTFVCMAGLMFMRMVVIGHR